MLEDGWLVARGWLPGYGDCHVAGFGADCSILDLCVWFGAEDGGFFAHDFELDLLDEIGDVELHPLIDESDESRPSVVDDLALVVADAQLLWQQLVRVANADFYFLVQVFGGERSLYLFHISHVRMTKYYFLQRAAVTESDPVYGRLENYVQKFFFVIGIGRLSQNRYGNGFHL